MYIYIYVYIYLVKEICNGHYIYIKSKFGVTHFASEEPILSEYVDWSLLSDS